MLDVMSEEPVYLESLGEFATLKNAIGSWFHQDAYLDFEKDEEIWKDIYDGHDEDARLRMINQLTELLRRKDKEILSVWNSESHSHNYSEAIEAREFLGAMLHFFKGQQK